MPAVQVPKEFFRKERQQIYANWPVGFWRELTQNAVDAGAITISITLEQQDGVVQVQFGDDGPGITRKVLEEVYFRLGETTKDGTLKVNLGGFGRARILTCFSMLRYMIRTQNLLVTGEGADYTIEEVDETVRGCHLTIDIDDASLDGMLEALRLFLRQSQLGCRVTVNGEPWTEWALRGTQATKLVYEDVEFATVYAQPTGLLNHVIVRSKGLQSFFMYSRVPMQVVIEIEPRLLRMVLTGNRDGLLLAYRNVLDAFLENMTLNASTLNRRRFRDEPMLVPEQTFTSTPRLVIDTEYTAADREMPDIFVFNEADDYEVAKNFMPDRWNESKRQVMLVWKIACRIAVDAMLQETRMPSLKWAVGWYFGDPTKKAVTKRKNDLHAFCVNPVDESGRFLFSPKSEVDQRRLLAMAKHEVTHAKYFSHDEAFASLYTEIDALVDVPAFYAVVTAALKELSDKDEQAKRRRRFGPMHMKVLQIWADHAQEHGGRLAREQAYAYWPDFVDPGQQHPLHARMTELADISEWGEPILIETGTKVKISNRKVKAWQLTKGGLRRFRAQLEAATTDQIDELSDEFQRNMAREQEQESLYLAFKRITESCETPPKGWFDIFIRMRHEGLSIANEQGPRFAARFNAEHTTPMFQVKRGFSRSK